MVIDLLLDTREVTSTLQLLKGGKLGLEVHGKTVEEAGQLAYAMAEASLNAIPGFVRRAMGYLWFSSLFRGRLKRRAAESQKREYPGGFVFSFVEGDGRTFDYAESVNENETPTVWN
jgi:hypothetical protein